MVNACVSHELRNPLNSIVAQNNLKKDIYKKLRKVIEDTRKVVNPLALEIMQKMSEELEELEESLKI